MIKIIQIITDYSFLDGFANPCVVFVFPHDLIPNALTKVTKTYKIKGLKTGIYRACFNPFHPYCFTNTADWITPIIPVSNNHSFIVIEV